jgi:hypothetical protein
MKKKKQSSIVSSERKNMIRVKKKEREREREKGGRYESRQAVKCLFNMKNYVITLNFNKLRKHKSFLKILKYLFLLFIL